MSTPSISAGFRHASHSALAMNVIFLSFILLVFAALCLVPHLLLLVILTTSAVEVHRFVSSQPQSFDATGSFAKFMIIWPLGMGSVVAFGLLAPATQDHHLGWFTVYINAAVLGNIAMMGFIPPGPHGVRGHSHRAACVLLVLWLIREMNHVGWRTVAFDGTFLLFNASPLAWVLAHACYRLIMLTLPPFDTLRYLVLEPASLGIMFLLSYVNDAAPSLWFGQADTLVASTVCFTSAFLGWFTPSTPVSLMRLPETPALDTACVAVHGVVCVVALAHLVY
ncbi:Aste57867_4709 [Aphanomyces stellatus]|uniref:Aste57867_4709 protein n=1 Tax=Aphanomyces stellatus TaxID=120398 RepID=A0A485KGU9_9STRA|nr:hypothetical protein As57867_004696 [Aphanomyces stellatus]VFT81809.1 Aste57867_4709 [Aphanomyces stellatus]